MKNDPIADYILKSEDNLGIAAAVAAAWPETRGKLVSAFLERLGARLDKKLKGWDWEASGGPFFLERYAGFYLWKSAWKHHSVGFQCGEYGGHMKIGIVRDTGDTRKLPLYEPLLRAVQKILPSATSQLWWEASVPMHSPAPDWRKPEVLWRIHKDAAFLTDVANQLLEIAEVSAPIIDGLTKKHAKSR